MQRSENEKNILKIQVSLTPAESKRLIAKAIKMMPVIQHALSAGRIIVDRSTTSGHILDELIEEKVDLSRYASGLIVMEGTCVTTNQISPRVLIRGQPQEVIQPEGKRMSTVFMEMLEDMGENDVFIKSANALDSEGNAGVLAASPGGGIIGRTQPVIHRKGVNLLIPCGLEKLIPIPITKASQEASIWGMDDSTGLPCDLIPVEGTVITEIEAIKILTGAEAIPIAAGGVLGAEGAVTLVIKGSGEQVRAIKEILKEVKGTKQVPVARRECTECPSYHTHFEKSPIRPKPCPGFWDE